MAFRFNKDNGIKNDTMPGMADDVQVRTSVWDFFYAKNIDFWMLTVIYVDLTFPQSYRARQCLDLAERWPSG
jgi:hypothetical protein